MQIFSNKLPKLHKSNIAPALFIMCLVACSPQSTPSETAPSQQLGNYQTIVSFEDEVLADPEHITFDTASGYLLVYDAKLESVMALNKNGTVTQTFGREGKGPGEYQAVSNIYALKNHIYIVDDRQYVIHRYNRDGTLDATMNYGQYGTHRMNNPIVVAQDRVLLPRATVENTMYTLRRWDGSKLADIGAVPKASTDRLSYDDYRAAVSSQTIPNYFKPHSFAVADSTSSNLFLIYEAFPKIHNYQLSGELNWQTSQITTSEIDSISTAYYNFMDIVLKRADAVRPLKKYVDAQVRNKKVFLSTSTDYDQPLWIHQFNGNGELMLRYNLESEVGLSSDFAISGEDKKFYVLTNEGDVRAYNF